MRIGVISDTHLAHLTQPFIEFVENRFRDCQAVVHTGDFTSPEVYYYLRDTLSKNFVAVHGNMDPPELRSLLRDKLIVNLEGVKIGVTHGWGAPHDLEERVRKLFDPERLRCIIYGHTHSGANHTRGNILFFNPGSPTDTYHAKVNSIGYLDIQEGEIEGNIVSVPTLERGVREQGL